MIRLSTVVLLVATLLAGGCGGSGGDAAGADGDGITAADIAYALTALNAMRAAEAPGAMLFVADAGLDAYARASNDEYDATRVPHSYFMAHPILPTCPAPIMPAAVGGPTSENEGLAGPGLSNMASIDGILAFFLAEKALPPGDPGRGHYEAIVNPGFNSVGIAIKRSTVDGFFVMTQEFCD